MSEFVCCNCGAESTDENPVGWADTEFGLVCLDCHQAFIQEKTKDEEEGAETSVGGDLSRVLGVDMMEHEVVLTPGNLPETIPLDLNHKAKMFKDIIRGTNE